MKLVELKGKEELLIEFVELLNYKEGIVEDYFRKLIEIGKLIKTCTDDKFKQKIKDKRLVDVCLSYYIGEKEYVIPKATIRSLVENLAHNAESFKNDGTWDDSAHERLNVFKDKLLEKFDKRDKKLI